MPEVLSENVISLTVPADKSMMLVIRLTTAGVLARARLTVDAIDDMKMAVEEACTLMISQQCPPAVVRAILGSLADAAEIDYSDGRIRNILLTKELRP